MNAHSIPGTIIVSVPLLLVSLLAGCGGSSSDHGQHLGRHPGRHTDQHRHRHPQCIERSHLRHQRRLLLRDQYLHHSRRGSHLRRDRNLQAHNHRFPDRDAHLHRHRHELAPDRHPHRHRRRGRPHLHPHHQPLHPYVPGHQRRSAVCRAIHHRHQHRHGRHLAHRRDRHRHQLQLLHPCTNQHLHHQP